MHLPSRPSVDCTQTPFNCTRYKTALYSSLSAEYFALQNGSSFDRNPAFQTAIGEVQLLKENVDAVNEDLSLSSLAIFYLPTLMSLPPIPIYDASDSVVLWYTFATDFLAALPLLIKGIELLIHDKAYKRSNVYGYTQDWHGSRHGVFETWYVGCYNETIKPGALIVSVAVWIIIASCLVKILFWRRNRARNRVDVEQEEALVPDTMCHSDDLPDSSNDEINQANSRTVKQTKMEKMYLLLSGNKPQRITIILLVWMVIIIFGLFFAPQYINEFEASIVLVYTIQSFGVLITMAMHLHLSKVRVYETPSVFFGGIFIGLFTGPV